MSLPRGLSLPFLGGLGAAIATASLLPNSHLIGGLILVIPASVTIVFLRTRFGRPHPPCTGRFWRHSGAAVLGAIIGLAAQGARGALGVPWDDVVAFRGVACQDSVAREQGGHLHRLTLLAAESADVRVRSRGTVRVLAAGGPATFAGELVVVHAGLQPTPGVDRDDYVSSTRGSEIRTGGFPVGLLAARSRMRLALDRRIRQLGYPVSGFFQAMLVGDRGGVEEDLIGLFRDAGCLHVLALSGMHLVLVFGAASLLVRPVPVAWVRQLLPLAVVGLYVFVAGPLPSLLRALAMLGVAWAARALDREAMALDLLATACALILLAQPRMLFDLSFQLSALAVAGMVTAGAGLADRVRAYLPRAAALPVCAGIGAQAAVAPLLFQATGLFRPVGLVSGLLVAPLASVLLIGGLIDLAVPPGTPFFHTYLRLGLHTIYRALDGVLRFFALARPGRSWVGIAFLWALVAATLAVRPLVRGREP